MSSANNFFKFEKQYSKQVNEILRILKKTRFFFMDFKAKMLGMEDWNGNQLIINNWLKSKDFEKMPESEQNELFLKFAFVDSCFIMFISELVEGYNTNKSERLKLLSDISMRFIPDDMKAKAELFLKEKKHDNSYIG